VSSSAALKWFVLVVLLLTLGWKVAARSYVSSQPDETAGATRVAEFLVRNHFELVESKEIAFRLQLFRAAAPACRMFVAVEEPRGWHRDLIRSLATATDRTFVVFGGRIYQNQPMLLTVSDFLWSRLMGQLGIGIHSRPVIAVIATPSCEADRLPWNELG